MTPEEVKKILKLARPDRPRKSDARRLQVAIDTAIDIINTYEEMLSEATPKIRT